jgi:pimeloyl-[acyl-carrier protein] methyl ester esterase
MVSSKYDVLIFYNYTNFFVDEKIINEINRYNEIIIISWSMGVYAASQVANLFKKPTKAIAINGTLTPLDNVCGIPVKRFDFTLNIVLKILSEKSINSFYKTTFKETRDFERFLTTRPLRPVAEQKEELECLMKLANFQGTLPLENIYDFAIIGLMDIVFLPQNQKNAWQNSKTRTIFIDEAHHPFYRWKNWEDIINLCS